MLTADFPIDPVLVSPSPKILHLGYNLSPEKMALKNERDRALLKREVELDPKNVMAWVHLGNLFIRTKEWAKLLRSTSNLCLLAGQGEKRECAPLMVTALIQRGIGYAMQERWADAIKSYLDALMLEPGDLDALFDLAVCYSRAGKPALSAETVRKYLAAEPAGATRMWRNLRRREDAERLLAEESAKTEGEKI